jgi:hypothetical protein
MSAEGRDEPVADRTTVASASGSTGQNRPLNLGRRFLYVAVVRAHIVFLGRAVKPAVATEASTHRAARLVCPASDWASQSSKHAHNGSERSLTALDQ